MQLLGVGRRKTGDPGRDVGDGVSERRADHPGPRLSEVPPQLVKRTHGLEGREDRRCRHRSVSPGRAPERHLGDLLSGAKAVEDRAAGEAGVTQVGVDLAPVVATYVRARHTRRLVCGEGSRSTERQRDAAQSHAGAAVGPQRRPLV